MCFKVLNTFFPCTDEGLKRYYGDNLPNLVQYKKKYDSNGIYPFLKLNGILTQCADIFKFPTSIPTSIPGSTG